MDAPGEGEQSPPGVALRQREGWQSQHPCQRRESRAAAAVRSDFGQRLRGEVRRELALALAEALAHVAPAGFALVAAQFLREVRRPVVAEPRLAAEQRAILVPIAEFVGPVEQRLIRGGLDVLAELVEWHADQRLAVPEGHRGVFAARVVVAVAILRAEKVDPVEKGNENGARRQCDFHALAVLVFFEGALAGDLARAFAREAIAHVVFVVRVDPVAAAVALRARAGFLDVERMRLQKAERAVLFDVAGAGRQNVHVFLRAEGLEDSLGQLQAGQFEDLGRRERHVCIEAVAAAVGGRAQADLDQLALFSIEEDPVEVGVVVTVVFPIRQFEFRVHGFNVAPIV